MKNFLEQIKPDIEAETNQIEVTEDLIQSTLKLAAAVEPEEPKRLFYRKKWAKIALPCAAACLVLCLFAGLWGQNAQNDGKTKSAAPQEMATDTAAGALPDGVGYGEYSNAGVLQETKDSSKEESLEELSRKDAGASKSKAQTEAADNREADITDFFAADMAVEQKIVKNASLSFTAKDADALYEAVLSAAKGLGGYEKDRRYQSGEDARHISFTLSVPPENLESFLGACEGLEGLEESSVFSQDITGEYYDLAARLEAAENSLAQYYVLMQKAQNVQEMLAVQQQIDNLMAQIEAQKGQMAVYDAEVRASQVEVTIYQKEKKQGESGFLSAGEVLDNMKKGFFAVVGAIVSGAQQLAIFLVSISPVLVILAAAAGIVFLIIKRKNKKGR